MKLKSIIFHTFAIFFLSACGGDKVTEPEPGFDDDNFNGCTLLLHVTTGCHLQQDEWRWRYLGECRSRLTLYEGDFCSFRHPTTNFLDGYLHNPVNGCLAYTLTEYLDNDDCNFYADQYYVHRDPSTLTSVRRVNGNYEIYSFFGFVAGR